MAIHTLTRPGRFPSGVAASHCRAVDRSFVDGQSVCALEGVGDERGVQGQFQYPEGIIVAVDHARSFNAHTLVVFAPGTHDELRETVPCLIALGVHRTEVFIDVFMAVENQGGARGDQVVPEGRVLIAVRLPATLRGITRRTRTAR